VAELLLRVNQSPTSNLDPKKNIINRRCGAGVVSAVRDPTAKKLNCAAANSSF
jgi:hypothetical protein